MKDPTSISISFPRFATAVACAVVLASIGCAASDGDEENRNDESAFAGVGGIAKPPTTVLAPPSTPTPDPAEVALNQKVAAAWAYAVGGSTSPTSLYPCANSAALLTALGKFRSRISLSNNPSTHMTTSLHACKATSSAQTVSVGGLTVGQMNVYCSLENDSAAREQPDASSIWDIPNQIDACWPGSKKYWQLDNWTEDDTVEDPTGVPVQHWINLTMHIDPEPAKLNSSLYSNGSSASATFVNSQALTYGYQWTGSWAPGSVPAGAPCATYAAGAGVQLLSTIQASGNYRKCM